MTTAPPTHFSGFAADNPWGVGQGFWHRLREEGGGVAFDSLALGLIDPRAPRPDALLTTQALGADPLEQWCASAFKEDRMLREARRRGLALRGTEDDEAGAGPPLPTGQHAMVHLLPVSLTEQRAWYLALGRSGTGFDEREQRRVALALRELQAAFDHVTEVGMGRLVLGEDARLIHADAGTEALVLDEPRFFDDLADLLLPVIEQRWPELADDRWHDAALTIGGRPRWVRFHRTRAATGMSHWHWYMELRPLDEGDIPPLGVVEDERVARAMAYLSDHFDQAPTLGEVAEAVHTSPFHFHRLFVRHVGRSPKHYLLRMQLMVAKWLLRATRTPIGEIATATGFASHGHFTATFHRVVGQSPSQYRETA